MKTLLAFLLFTGTAFGYSECHFSCDCRPYADTMKFLGWTIAGPPWCARKLADVAERCRAECPPIKERQSVTCTVGAERAIDQPLP